MMREPIKKRLMRVINHRLVKVLAGVALFYLLFAYFAVNPLAKKIVPWIAETKLASKASVGEVTFDPWRLKVTINRFALAENTGAPLASFKQLMVDFEMAGMFKRAWQFRAIRLDEPLVTVAFAKDGRFNWRDVITQLNKDKTPPSDTIPRLIVGNIAVNRGNIAYSDARHTTPTKLALTPLSFQLAGFSTLPQDRGNYLISAQLANHGGRLKMERQYRREPGGI